MAAYMPSEDKDHSLAYLPTQEQIAEECELIRAEWTDDERLKRLRHDWRNKTDNRSEIGMARIGDVVDNWIKYGEGRKTVVFASGVGHSRHLAEAFNAAGYNFAHLDGKTGKDDRDHILGALDDGRLDGVCNCAVLHEGWDQPGVGCMVDAQPTKSYGRHLQKVGRVLRPDKSSGKTDAIIIDHAGNVYRHGSPEEAGGWSLDDSIKIQEVRKEKRTENDSMQTCRHCFNVYKGHVCPSCGAVPDARSKALNIKEGRLVEVKKPKKKLNEQETWNECLWKAYHRKMKMGAVYHMYVKKMGKKPGHNLERVPRGADWRLSAPEYIDKTKGEKVA